MRNDTINNGLGSDRVLGVVDLDIDASVLGKLVGILAVHVVQGRSVSVDNNIDLVDLLQNLIADTVRSTNNDLIDILLSK